MNFRLIVFCSILLVSLPAAQSAAEPPAWDGTKTEDKAIFDSLDEDPEWARSVENELTVFISQTWPDMDATVNCRQSACYLVLVSEDRQDVGDVVEMLWDFMPSANGSYHETQTPDGEHQLTWFMGF